MKQTFFYSLCRGAKKGWMKFKCLRSRTLLLALGLLACFMVKAQKIPMIDSLGTFTGNFPPAEWTRVNEGGSSWNVSWGGGAPGNQGNHIYVPANAGESNDAWMLTPQLMPTAGNHTLSFYIKSDKDTIDNTVFEVMLSEGGNALKDFTVSLSLDSRMAPTQIRHRCWPTVPICTAMCCAMCLRELMEMRCQR